VTTEIEDHTEERACASYFQLLAANHGRRVVVETHDGARLEGTVHRVLAEEGERVSDVDSSALHQVLRLKSCTRTVQGSLVVLRTDDGDVVLSADHIRRVTVPERATLSCPRSVRTELSRKALTLRFEQPRVHREVLLMYFTPGLRWIPTYRVELAAEDGDTKRARVSLQAEILNQLEDIDSAVVDLVVGVPSFRFREVISPLSLEETMRNALEQAAPQLMGRLSGSQLSNALFTQRAGEWRPETPAQAAAGGAASPSSQLDAGGEHDLFVHHLGTLTLAFGHRAAVPLVEMTVPYRDIYTWDLAVTRGGSPFAPGSQGLSPLALSENRVWHQVELENTSDVPWTTGAVLLMTGTLPLGQELLTYTPRGGTARVPVTVAMDLRGTFSEEEVAREAEALRWAGSSYARIHTRGRLELKSHKAQPVEVEITCELPGRVTEASHDGAVVLSAYRSSDWTTSPGDAAANNHSTVRWRLSLQPGETTTPEVHGQYLVRHR
jgi:hypothetical protein